MQIREHLPGSIGRIVEMHGRYYASEWRFSSHFEATVAKELGEFMTRFDPARDGFWIATQADEILGGIVIDGTANPGAARLRFFIVDDAHRGAGLGEQLMSKALTFCRDARHQHIFLNTFSGLHSARKLYERHGFMLTKEGPHQAWGATVTEQRFDLRLNH